MSQLKIAEGGSEHVSGDELTPLLKSSLTDGFQLCNNRTFSIQKDKKRPLKRKKGPEYRRINRYFKSVKQYKKERERRKQVLHMTVVEYRTQQYIADKLGVSVSTVKRDLKKLRPYITGQINRAIRAMQKERDEAWQRRMEGLSLWEQFDVLSEEMDRYRQLWAQRDYRSHNHVVWIDLTQTDKYGVPKCTSHFKGKRLAYPHTVSIMCRWEYQGQVYEHTIGGWTITQTTRRY